MNKRIRRAIAALLAAVMLLMIPASGKYVSDGYMGTVRLIYSKTFMIRAPSTPFSTPPNNLGTGEAGNGTPYTGATSGYFVVRCGVNDGWYYCYLRGGNSASGAEGSEIRGFIHLSEARYYISAGSNGFPSGSGTAYGLVYPGTSSGGGGSSSIHRMTDTTGSGYEEYDLTNNVIAVTGGSSGQNGFLRHPISAGTNTSVLGVLDNIGIASMADDITVQWEIRDYITRMVTDRRGLSPIQPCVILVYLGPDNPTTTTYTIN